MLLGLIRAECSPAARILRNLGFTSDELYETVKTETAERIAARDKERARPPLHRGSSVARDAWRIPEISVGGAVCSVGSTFPRVTHSSTGGGGRRSDIPPRTACI
jgi:hypothetical protein